MFDVRPGREWEVVKAQSGGVPDHRLGVDFACVRATVEIREESLDQFVVAHTLSGLLARSRASEPFVDHASSREGCEQISLDAFGQSPFQRRIPPLQDEVRVSSIDTNSLGRFNPIGEAFHSAPAMPIGIAFQPERTSARRIPRSRGDFRIVGALPMHCEIYTETPLPRTGSGVPENTSGRYVSNGLSAHRRMSPASRARWLSQHVPDTTDLRALMAHHPFH